MDYQQYLLSPHWRKTRLAKLRRGIRHGGYHLCPKCRCMVARQYLHVHHLQSGYQRLGRERDQDLELACEGCHATIHDLEPPTWWTEAKDKHNSFSDAEYKQLVLDCVRNQAMVVDDAIVGAAIVLAPRIGPPPLRKTPERHIADVIRDACAPERPSDPPSPKDPTHLGIST